jgi:hypothetical protein
MLLILKLISLKANNLSKSSKVKLNFNLNYFVLNLRLTLIPYYRTGGRSSGPEIFLDRKEQIKRWLTNKIKIALSWMFFG